MSASRRKKARAASPIECPVCFEATITRFARTKLYLGIPERCPDCMGGWRFALGKWLYLLPLSAIFALELTALLLLGVLLNGLVVLAAIVLTIVFVPHFLEIEPRFGDRLTEHAIRRKERDRTGESRPER